MTPFEPGKIERATLIITLDLFCSIRAADRQVDERAFRCQTRIEQSAEADAQMADPSGRDITARPVIASVWPSKTALQIHVEDDSKRDQARTVLSALQERISFSCSNVGSPSWNEPKQGINLAMWTRSWCPINRASYVECRELRKRT